MSEISRDLLDDRIDADVLNFEHDALAAHERRGVHLPRWRRDRDEMNAEMVNEALSCAIDAVESGASATVAIRAISAGPSSASSTPTTWSRGESWRWIAKERSVAG